MKRLKTHMFKRISDFTNSGIDVKKNRSIQKFSFSVTYFLHICTLGSTLLKKILQ